MLAGCTGDENAQDYGPPPSKSEELPSTDTFYQCDENVADHVLLVRFTAPNVFDGRHPFRIPFRKAEPKDTTLGGGGVSFNGTGPDGGFNAFISIDSSTDTSLAVRVDLRWSLSDKEGEIEELIHVTIGKAGNKVLSEGRKITWRFAAPE